jgi:hypothetical protein
VTESTFDASGYPSEDTLHTIRTWPADDAASCLEYVRRAWSDYGSVRDTLSIGERSVLGADRGRFLRFATGGWSGNEDLIGALDANVAVSARTWRMTARGGVHIYEVPS